jgi:hypothetical protein
MKIQRLLLVALLATSFALFGAIQLFRVHEQAKEIKPVECHQSLNLYDDSVGFIYKDTLIGICKQANVNDTIRNLYFTGHGFITIWDCVATGKCLWVPVKDTCQLKSCYLDWQSNHITFKVTKQQQHGQIRNCNQKIRRWEQHCGICS